MTAASSGQIVCGPFPAPRSACGAPTSAPTGHTPPGRLTSGCGATGRPDANSAHRAVRPRAVLPGPLPVLRFRRVRGRGRSGAQGSDRWNCSTRSRRSSNSAPTSPMLALGRPRIGRALQSIYFGGGTPSLMPPARVERLIAIAARRYGIDDDAEITLEANPGPDEVGDMAAFRRAGVNRVSLGAQSFDTRRAEEPRPSPLGGGHRRGGSGREKRRDRLSQPRSPVRRPGPERGLMGGLARFGTRTRTGPSVALRADPRRSRCRRAHRPVRRSPVHVAPAPAAGAIVPERIKTTIGRRTSTSTRPRCSRHSAGATTRSRTGLDPATRAATT